MKAGPVIWLQCVAVTSVILLIEGQCGGFGDRSLPPLWIVTGVGTCPIWVMIGPAIDIMESHNWRGHRGLKVEHGGHLNPMLAILQTTTGH